MGEFSGKVAIVTGSSSGIGESTALRLAELGAHVVVNSSTSVEAGQRVAASLATKGAYVQADISDQAQGQRLIDQTIETFGRLDILVNNAGWTTLVQHHDLDGLTDEIFDKTFKVNVYGTWWLTKAAIPHLRKSEDGNVVNITSIAGVRPVGSSMAYAMNIHFERFVEDLVGEAIQVVVRHERGPASVVHQNVESTERFYRLVDESLTLCLIADVGLHVRTLGRE